MKQIFSLTHICLIKIRQLSFPCFKTHDNRTCHFIVLSAFVLIVFMVNSGALASNIIVNVPPHKSKSIPACSIIQSGNSTVLYFNLDSGNVTVSAENETGDMVYETNTTATSGSSLAIDTSGWESGSYTLMVTSSSGLIYTTVVDIL